MTVSRFSRRFLLPPIAATLLSTGLTGCQVWDEAGDNPLRPRLSSGGSIGGSGSAGLQRFTSHRARTPDYNRGQGETVYLPQSSSETETASSSSSVSSSASASASSSSAASGTQTASAPAPRQKRSPQSRIKPSTRGSIGGSGSLGFGRH